MCVKYSGTGVDGLYVGGDLEKPSEVVQLPERHADQDASLEKGPVHHTRVGAQVDWRGVKGGTKGKGNVRTSRTCNNCSAVAHCPPPHVRRRTPSTTFCDSWHTLDSFEITSRPFPLTITHPKTKFWQLTRSVRLLTDVHVLLLTLNAV